MREGVTHVSGHLGRNDVYVHSRNTGVLALPGAWGWELPGSPGWGDFLSLFDTLLAAGDYALPADRRMPAEHAREAFRRMRYRHHVQQQDLFVNGWFDVQNYRFSATGVLSFRHERRPDVYARIMEREEAAPGDAEVMALLAGVNAAYAGTIDVQGIIPPELDRLVAATDRAVAAHGAALGEDLRREWANVRQRYADAPFERRLAGFRQALSDLTDDTFGTVVTDRTRRQAAALREAAEGTAGPRVLQRIRAVERLVNLTPPVQPPSSLLLLIDTSGSMDGEVGSGNPEIRIVAARSAASAALEQAADSGRMEAAVLAFSGECHDPVPRYLDFTTDVARLTAFIDGLRAGGGTRTAPALQDLQRVAVESGGTYHHAASAEELAELFLEVVDPFTVMDLFGTIDQRPAAGVAAPHRQ